jgi:hypothetical protein
LDLLLAEMDLGPSHPRHSTPLYAIIHRLLPACLDWPPLEHSGKLELTWTNKHDWRYLLVGETDVAEARGCWATLKKLGR